MSLFHHPIAWLLLTLSAFSHNSRAQDELPRTAEKFEIGGHTAFLYAAPQPAPGRPWIWYAPTLKGVSLAGRKVYFESFLRAGISIAGYDIGEVRGAPASTAKFHAFFEEMVKRGWSSRPILIGQSRGGIMMLSWAVRHPENVRAFVGIYPVCNLASWPLKNSLAPTLADYGLTEQALRSRLAELNPIEHLQPLAERRVPVFIVQGDSDVVVPHADNARLLQERYEKLGGPITVKVIPGEGHKVSPSFFECPELVAFVLAQAKESPIP